MNRAWQTEGRMEIFRFDRGERTIDRFSSVGATATRIAAGEGELRLTYLTVDAGGTIGTHPAVGAQLFMIVSGEGWVAGEDGVRLPLAAGSGVRWDDGEIHSSGTAAGFTAVAAEGAPMSLFE